MKVRKYRHDMEVVQIREALAVLVVENVVLIDLLVFEQIPMFDWTQEIGMEQAIAKARATWHQQWVDEIKRRWMHPFIFE